MEEYLEGGIKMKKYILQNESGLYWTGSNWSVEQSADHYVEDTIPDVAGEYVVHDATLPPLDRIWYGPDNGEATPRRLRK